MKPSGPSTRRPTQSFFRSKMLLILACIVLVLLAIAFGRAYMREYASRQEIAQLEAEAARLKGEQVQLLELLSYVQTDAYVEETAREKLHLKKPGEEVVVFSAPTSSLNYQVPEHKHPIQRWVEYFFNPS